MLAATRRPGHRLADLSPFELEQDPGRARAQEQERSSALTRPPQAESAHGCVEWFHYLDSPAAKPAAAPRRARR